VPGCDTLWAGELLTAVAVRVLEPPISTAPASPGTTPTEGVDPRYRRVL
jgi:hypothetical protein